MNATEAHDELVEIRKRVEDLLRLAMPREWESVDDTLAVWDIADDLIRQLNVFARDCSTVIAEVIPGEYAHPNLGVFHTASSRTDRWDGAAVLDRLGVQMIDPNSGEMETAIPVSVLKEVIPACGPKATSSKWKIKALSDYIDVNNLHSVEYKKPQVRRGARPRYGS